MSHHGLAFVTISRDFLKKLGCVVSKKNLRLFHMRTEFWLCMEPIFLIEMTSGPFLPVIEKSFGFKSIQVGL